MSAGDAEGALILLYHRITRLARDPQLLCVSPENFSGHLEVLRRSRDVVPLAQIVADLKNGHPRPGTVAITFDDGYADNLLEAAPILHQFEMPATVFATTAHAGGSHAEFFWDDLDRIFLSPGTLPVRGRLVWEGGGFEIDLGAGAAYPQADADRFARWTVLDETDPTPRHRTYRELRRILHRGTVSIRRNVLEQLQTWSGAPSRPTHRMMSFEQMRDIAGGGLIDIGGHTVDHPALSAETTESQIQQVERNKSALESALGRPLAGFSYPFGTRHDFTGQTVGIVKEAEYQYACANFAATVTSATDPMRLPRVIARDWAPGEFERRLST